MPPVEDSKTAIEMFARDMGKTFGEIKDTLVETNRILRNDVGNLNRTMLSNAANIDRTRTSFLKETFSNTFNKPALWTRDIVAMSGLKEYRDMTKVQAEYYARQHWKQRGELIGTEASSFAAYGIGAMFGLPGIAAATGYDMAIKPLIERHIVRKHEWWNRLDRYGKRNILAGRSSNIITHTGWDDPQLEQLSKYMTTSYRGTGFKKEESDEMVMMAEESGYFKNVSTIDTYKRKYKELLKGVKEIMQVLHTSQGEAVSVMSDISQMKVARPMDYIKQLNVTAAYTGLSPGQLTSWSAGMSANLYQNYGINKEWGANLALEMAKNPLYTGIQQKGFKEFMKNPVFLAGMSTYSEGKWTLDKGTIDQFISGDLTMEGLMNRAAVNFGGEGEDSAQRILAFEANKGQLIKDMDMRRGGVMFKGLALSLATDTANKAFPVATGIEMTNAVKVALGKSKFGLTAGEIEEIMKFREDPFIGVNMGLELEGDRVTPETKGFMRTYFGQPIQNWYYEAKYDSIKDINRQRSLALLELSTPGGRLLDIFGIESIGTRSAEELKKTIREKVGDHPIVGAPIKLGSATEEVQWMIHQLQMSDKDESKPLGIIYEEIDKLTLATKNYEINKDIIEQAQTIGMPDFLTRTLAPKAAAERMRAHAIMGGYATEEGALYGWQTGLTDFSKPFQYALDQPLYIRDDRTIQEKEEMFRTARAFSEIVFKPYKKDEGLTAIITRITEEGGFNIVGGEKGPFAIMAELANKKKAYNRVTALQQMGITTEEEKIAYAKIQGIDVEQVDPMIMQAVTEHARTVMPELRLEDYFIQAPEAAKELSLIPFETIADVLTTIIESPTEEHEKLERLVIGSKALAKYLGGLEVGAEFKKEGRPYKDFYAELREELPFLPKEQIEIFARAYIEESDEATIQGMKTRLEEIELGKTNIERRAHGIYGGEDYEDFITVMNNLIVASEKLTVAADKIIEKLD